MTEDEIDTFLVTLKGKGWMVERTDDADLRDTFRERYPRIPQDYLDCLRRVRLCAIAEGNVWFLCADDYNGTNSSAFAWNEFELMELEAVEEDEEDPEPVKRFSDAHLPFMLSVRADYAYLAFSLSDDDFGSVVAGYAPDFREVTPLFASFKEFTDCFAAVLRGEASNPDLNYFV